MCKYVLQVQKKTTRIASRASCSKFELQVAISCNLKIFTCWPSEALHNGPSALLAKLIRSSLIEFKLRKNIIYDANDIPIYKYFGKLPFVSKFELQIPNFCNLRLHQTTVLVCVASCRLLGKWAMLVLYNLL